MAPMKTIPESDQEVQEEEVFDEEFESSNRCLALLCLPLGFKKIDATSRRPLLHGDLTREKWWVERTKGAHAFVLRSMESFKLRRLLQKLRCNCTIKRRKPMLRYDSKSYRLNFDEGDELLVDDVGLLKV